MINTQLILLEGLSGSGKSFTSQLLTMQLQRNEHLAEWVYEEQVPHPVYNRQQLDQMIAIALCRHRLDNGQATIWDRLKLFSYKAPCCYQKALDHWQKLVAQTRLNGNILVMDGGFFQTPLLTLLAMESSDEKMLAYSLEVAKIIAPLNPIVIHLYQDDVAQAINDNFSRRGDEFRHYIQDRIRLTPFANSRSALKIDQVTLEFFQHYMQIINHISRQLPLAIKEINNSDGDWQRCNAMIAGFLEIPVLQESCQPLNPLSDLAGRYQLAGKSDDVFNIIIENEGLTLTSPSRLRLFHKQDNLFCVEGTLNECCFVKDQDNKVTQLNYKMPGIQTVELIKL